ncbi:MAG: hypothetical protein QNL04_09725 [SAR324 cluster bacterium]|nr:hypothetical protein [SAR324 cluster bacterium]
MSKNDWHNNALQLIRKIPSGFLVSYGVLNEALVVCYGYGPGARQVARFRKKLYGELGHETDIPLHSIAKKDDESLADSEETREKNTKKREAEGFFKNPKWMKSTDFKNLNSI